MSAGLHVWRGWSDAVTYSVRRRYLDRDLAATAGAIAGRVLEVGCGRTGRRGRFHPPLSAVDRWIFMDRDAAREPHVRADAAALPLGRAAVDTVLCLEVLEYVWNPASVLAEFGRVLRPGGLLVLSTPFLHRADAADDYWRFTEPALRRLLNEAGFDVDRVLPQGHALAVAANVLRYAVSVQRSRIRRALSVLLRPVFALFLRGDAPQSRRHAELGTFSTGYLVIAHNRGTGRA